MLGVGHGVGRPDPIYYNELNVNSVQSNQLDLSNVPLRGGSYHGSKCRAIRISVAGPRD